MEQWPDQFHATIGFDPKLAHQIESAADLYLMPSRFEPCGLGQLYSLRYGAVPIVHATGGLDDSIQPLDGAGATGNGFKFREYSSGALLTATTEAVERYRADAVAWRQVLSRVMREDHSWDRSARRYLDLYARATGLPA
jgi:starch synthase